MRLLKGLIVIAIIIIAITAPMYIVISIIVGGIFGVLGSSLFFVIRNCSRRV